MAHFPYCNKLGDHPSYHIKMMTDTEGNPKADIFAGKSNVVTGEIEEGHMANNGDGFGLVIVLQQMFLGRCCQSTRRVSRS